MINKYNAQKVYWHPRCGYFRGKNALDNYLEGSNDDAEISTLEGLEITRDNFQVFDSAFEADIHKLLNRFVAKNPGLILFTQVQIDLSQPAFCKMGYKVDFAIGRLKPMGFTPRKLPENFPENLNGVAYCDLKHLVEVKGLTLIEAKGMFLPESRYKHLLLENKGIEHGKHIEIVQATPSHVSRGTKCYKSISPKQLLDKLNQRFNQEGANN